MRSVLQQAQWNSHRPLKICSTWQEKVKAHSIAVKEMWLSATDSDALTKVRHKSHSLLSYSMNTTQPKSDFMGHLNIWFIHKRSDQYSSHKWDWISVEPTQFLMCASEASNASCWRTPPLVMSLKKRVCGFEPRFPVTWKTAACHLCVDEKSQSDERLIHSL